MKKLLITIAAFCCTYIYSYSQGCVAIKSNGGYCSMADHHQAAGKNKGYTLSINHRYFRSYKHFVGTEEQKQRVEAGTEVVNYSHAVNFNLNKALHKGWSVSLDIPVLANNRSSLYEYGGKSRHSTKSFGLGDVRIAAYKWIIDPVRMTKGNIQAGLGLKLPTGDYKYQDNFFVNDSTQILGPVDQSIQLGDGGLGFTTEVNAYYTIAKGLTAYGNFYYLINPREQNGTSTARGGTPSVTAVRYGSHVMSVPDQYMLRAGVNYTFKKLTASAGVRKECLTSKDLFGGNNGFRRPGYIVSFEPGVTYDFKNFSLYTYVPVALKRNRTQSEPDRIRTQITGVYAQGDAAFADFAVNVGLNFKF
jgi:hypothetical protein